MDDQVRALLPHACDWCPRACGADRAARERGVCGAADQLRIARAALHHWEEPPISGDSGSGTVFFSYCPLRCVYCQNHSIALGSTGANVSLERLVQIFLEQQDRGALNLNMVTPTHFAPIISEALRLARARGLHLPVVWNTAGYETVSSVRSLQGVADVFLTDFKYASAETAAAYSHAPDYVPVALAALDQMVAQSGEMAFDEYRGQSRMTRGVIVRHLLLPGRVEESKRLVELLWDRYGDRVLYSIMNQYTPVIDPAGPVAKRHPELLVRPTSQEYEELLDHVDSLGLEDYFWQDGEAARESFIPTFDLEGVL
ncbi:MAG: radical SAM protein [Coriobacteriia bacterium]|nr:radical SAM protein [Coriobacteriia bacterium]